MKVHALTPAEYIQQCVEGRYGWPTKEMLETLVKLAKVEAFKEAADKLDINELNYMAEELERELLP